MDKKPENAFKSFSRHSNSHFVRDRPVPGSAGVLAGVFSS
jgi:hypothetical protein